MRTTAFLAIAALVLAGCAAAPSAAAPATRTESCRPTDEREIAALFDRWNRSLQTGDAKEVVANYAARSVLLATTSNLPRVSAREKEDYFREFLKDKPSGRIVARLQIEIDCNTAADVGLYTFIFAATGEEIRARYTYTYRWDGARWLITSHHSSAMPQKN